MTQLSAGVYGNDLASYPDEAAHFVSAVCLVDYVARAPGSDPVRFAQACYAHFPKVAFGHWPPGFFLEQAVWYAVFGASPSAGLLLVGMTAVLAGLLLFRTIQGFYGMSIAGVSVAVYLALPTVRSATTMLMPDLVVSLFAFMAVGALADGCVRDRWRPWLACAVWSSALVLTKESGLIILLFAPAGFLLFGGRQRSSRRAAYFWGSLAAFGLATLAGYAGTGVLQMRGLPAAGALPPIGTRIGFLKTFVDSTPWLVLAIAATGAAAALAMRSAARERRIHCGCHTLWVALWLIAQVVARDVIEPRYFLPAVPSLIVLVAAGIDWIDDGVRTVTREFTIPAAFRRAITAVATGICCVVLMPPTAVARRRGYTSAIDALRRDAAPHAVLVSSDASGAGALIADLVARRRDEDVFAIRSDKVLAASDWMGAHARLLTSSRTEILNVLDSIPVRYVILDAHASIHDGDRPAHRLLRETVFSRPDRFRTIASLPIFIDGVRYDDALQVFENVATAAGASTSIRVPSSGLAAVADPSQAWRWTPRSSASVDRDVAIARIIDRMADRLSALLPLPSRAVRLPPLRPSSDRVGSAGALGELFVAQDIVDSTVRSSDPWIRVSGDGEGARIVRYAVAANDSPRERRGFIAVGAVLYPLWQAGRP